jgi:hypothetical protein
MKSELLKSAIRSAFSANKIDVLLSARTATVLERLSRGGGATRWYFCADKLSLEAVAAKLSPGSVVSFYFDDRIRSDLHSRRIQASIEEIIAKEGDAVVGTLAEDGVRIDVQIVAGPKELVEFLSAIASDRRVFYGAFPGRDNDGVEAVTLTIPDADGTVRNHPH